MDLGGEHGGGADDIVVQTAALGAAALTGVGIVVVCILRFAPCQRCPCFRRGAMYRDGVDTMEMTPSNRELLLGGSENPNGDRHEAVMNAGVVSTL